MSKLILFLLVLTTFIKESQAQITDVTTYTSDYFSLGDDPERFAEKHKIIVKRNGDYLVEILIKNSDGKIILYESVEHQKWVSLEVSLRVNKVYDMTDEKGKKCNILCDRNYNEVTMALITTAMGWVHFHHLVKIN